MTLAAAFTALVCAIASFVLAAMAWQRLGVARGVLRTRATSTARLAPGWCKVTGVLEPAGPVVVAPFTDRPALWTRATLYGAPPPPSSLPVEPSLPPPPMSARPARSEIPTGAYTPYVEPDTRRDVPRALLWEKILIARARVGEGRHQVVVKLEGAQVLVPREWRQGALRALVPEVPVVPRVLARAGYRTPPPSTQFFELEEEVLPAGERVTVLGVYDGQGAIGPGPQGRVLVSTLNPWRIVLRVAWGPALAMLLALIIAATGATVVGTFLWLR